jgi:hypothetical protein
VPATPDHAPLHEVLSRDLDGVTRQWQERFHTAPVRIPGRVADAEVHRLGAPILESLEESLRAVPPAGGGEAAPPRLLPGSTSVREVEKSVAFAGASLASSTATAFDVAALVQSLRDALLEHTEGAASVELGRFFEWLTVVALDAFGSARADAVRERTREELEEGTPVVLVGPELPAALLVGAPEAAALDAIFGRLVLLVVRVGADTVLLDVGGLVDPLAPAVLDSFERFIGHERIAGRVTVAVASLHGDAEPAWRARAGAAGAEIAFSERFDFAMAHAGFTVVRRRTV